MLSRQKKVLAGITRSMRGLEIGPSYNPVVPKSDGWNVQSVDHASQEILQEKYRGLGADWQRIEPVDFVCGDNDFLKAIPTQYHGSYDYIIASHMIEHTTDLIGFLGQMEALLAQGGVLSLIVPDKSYCFDFMRPVTNTADILYANYQKRGTHSIKTAFEHVAYHCSYDDLIIWGNPVCNPKGFALSHRLDQAMDWFTRLSDEGGEYADFHNWKFTPASFRLIMLELQALEKTGLSARSHHPTESGEFFLQLVKGKKTLPSPDSPELQAMRLELLVETQRDIYHATSMLFASPVAAAPPRRHWVVRFARWLLPSAIQPVCQRLYHLIRPLYHRSVSGCR